MQSHISKSRILNLYKVALADGKASKDEMQFIFDVASDMGLSQDEVLDVINHQDDFELEYPDTVQARTEHLLRLLFLMKLDGDINPKEVALIQQTALLLGLNLEMTDELIELIRQYKNGLVPEQKTVAIIKTYLN